MASQQLPFSAWSCARTGRVSGSAGNPVRWLPLLLRYRYYVGTRVGDKYLCVVVKLVADDAFVLTAYLTDTVKKGRLLWPARN
jgi:hypothetical protein